MRYFKLTLFLLGFLIVLLGGNSMENRDQALEDCLSQLQGKFDVIKNPTYPNGYPLPSEGDMLEIENKLGYSLPEALKNFYRVAGNLQLEGFEPADPTHGCNSELYNLIQDCQKKMKILNKSEWLPFCSANGLTDFFCIHIPTGKIHRYVAGSGFEKKEVYLNFSDWATKSWLS
jgi:hypothetical protein